MPTIEEFEEARESNQGYCLTCKAWTHDYAEPDARKYKCEECGKNTVYGAEEVLMMGLVH
jgi:Zn finger protein HypA/HybF involved in hydrogenase expression